ncbi:MAG TPA: AAA family ATPase, partial [Solirubrobacteraceae bacterium]|nr:AAA family ATPase [Solirubrobacteraceae bacterium]
AARAARLTIDRDLGAALGPVRSPRSAPARSEADAEVVLIMGIPGAGKTRLADAYVTRGFARLNRDERGGALRALAAELDGLLAGGARRVVLDNTYLTRAARSYVIEAAGRHGAQTRCVWLQTPLAQAQVNMVERLLARFGSLPTPEDLRVAARREPGLLAPTQQMRALRQLEPPSADEGFASVEVIEFARAAASARTGSGVFVAAAAVDRPGWEQTLAELHPRGPHLIFDWRPGASPDVLAPLAPGMTARSVETAVCPHGPGPPRCWCRPPLPGLPLAFAHSHDLDPARCALIGTSAAHRTLAASLGARYVDL